MKALSFTIASLCTIRYVNDTISTIELQYHQNTCSILHYHFSTRDCLDRVTIIDRCLIAVWLEIEYRSIGADPLSNFKLDVTAVPASISHTRAQSLFMPDEHSLNPSPTSLPDPTHPETPTKATPPRWTRPSQAVHSWTSPPNFAC